MIPLSKELGLIKKLDESSNITYIFKHLTGPLSAEYYNLLAKVQRDGSGQADLTIWIIDNLMTGWESDSLPLPEFPKRYPSKLFTANDIQNFGPFVFDFINELTGMPIETAKN